MGLSDKSVRFGLSVDSQKPDDDFQKDLRRYSGLGVDLVTNTLVGIGLGYLLDLWLGTLPWFMVSGLVLGSVAGFVSVFRAINKQDKDEPKK